MKKKLLFLCMLICLSCLFIACGEKKADNTIEFKEMTLTLPDSWKGHYVVDDHITDSSSEKVNSLTVFHKESKEAWEKEGEEESGTLFALGFSKKKDFTELPDYSLLGKTNAGYYYIIYPTDVQSYVMDDKISKQYSELAKDYKTIEESVAFTK